MIFLILIFIQLTLSLEIKMSKDSYQPRETLQAEISGNFISLKSENIMIYKENKVHSEPIIQGLTKQDRVYYYYAVLPNQEGNFSLRIENAEYIKSGDIVSDTIIKNFTIKQTNESSQSINPGFIFTKKDFSIKVKALNKDQDISISFENYTYNIFLFEEFEELVPFSIAGITTKKSILKIGNYNIPVFIVNNITENITNQSSPISQIDFSIDNLNAIIFTNRTYFFSFYLENTGEANLTNINLTNSFNATIIPSKIDSLKTQEKAQVNLTIFIKEKQKKNISGEITAKIENYSFSIPVYFEITENLSKVTLPGINNTNTLSCKNIGKICLEDEECKGQLTPSLEAACCIGECVKKKTSSSGNWIYGVIILIIVLAVVGFVFWKYKQKNPRSKTMDEIVKQKVDLKKINRNRPGHVEEDEGEY